MIYVKVGHIVKYAASHGEHLDNFGVVIGISRRFFWNDNYVIARLDKLSIIKDNYKNTFPLIQHYIPEYRENRFINLITLKTIPFNPKTENIKVITSKNHPIGFQIAYADILRFRNIKKKLSKI